MSNIALGATATIPTGIVIGSIARTRVRTGARVPSVTGPLGPGRTA